EPRLSCFSRALDLTNAIYRWCPALTTNTARAIAQPANGSSRPFRLEALQVRDVLGLDGLKDREQPLGSIRWKVALCESRDKSALPRYDCSALANVPHRHVKFPVRGHSFSVLRA